MSKTKVKQNANYWLMDGPVIELIKLGNLPRIVLRFQQFPTQRKETNFQFRLSSIS